MVSNLDAVRRYRAKYPDRVRVSNLDSKHLYRETERGATVDFAHVLVQRAMRAGTLLRQSCSKCGDANSQGHHHRGYDYPLDVVWLCATHHKEAHSNG